ncbi:hypothetical protein D9Q98_004667 [Chlorella vulgaris]|uniref:Uncharacterized protein n=1 Tax=Chlorella vulgaris TaxID=3077 RepID=A0A9D4TQD9_CHLVU|nr:hypothetical protein D9Q98_004667 [Chlorella vulgaris]
MAAAPAAAIKPIDKGTIHRICSGQVILDLATAVKELVENALDAGATSIEIRLKEYGGELLEVADNGHGVSPENYQALTLKYHTSKLANFTDLQELGTFGFRGEALSSLCAVADVSVVTRTTEQEVGVRLSYDPNGLLVEQAGAARTVGTTIAVRELFKRLPVRHGEFLRHIKREYARLVALLQAYALISTGVRIICTNQVGSGTRTTVVNTRGSPCVRDNILAVFGGKAADSMDPLQVEELHSGVTAAGWVSKANVSSGRASGDRQFFFLNGRPVDLPKAAKVLNDTYRSLGSPATAASKPMAVVDFRLPTDSYDVNVTPDKRKVFLHAEQRIMAAFQQGLQALWEPSRNTYDVQDTLGVTQQAQRGGSGSGRAAVAAGARSIPLQSFSQFSRASPVGVASAAGASPGAKRLQHQQQGGDGEEEGGEEVHEQEQGSPAEPPSKRRAVLPLAAFALGVGSQQTAAGPDSQDQAMQEQQEQQQEQAVGKQRSLLSFGFLQSKPEPGGREHSSRGQLECQHPQQHPQQQDLEEGFEGDGGGGAEGSGRSLNALRQPAATAAVLETTPVVVAADEDAQQRQQQQQQQWDQGQGGGGGAGDSEGDDMYELSDAEAGERGGAQPEEPAAAGQANAAVAEPAAGEGAAAAAAVAGAAEAGGATQAANTGGDITAAVDLAGMRRRLLAAARSSATAAAAQQAGRRRRSQFAAASLASGSGGAGEAGLSREQAEAVAEQELARVFHKADFLRLEVVGQFNLGFILARLDRDLFIIDQHASDEKYNFERLQRTTTLNRQPLLAPQALELSPTEELTVRDNLEVFTRNGFDFCDDTATGRLRLSAVPFSKNTTFGAGDVLELVTLLDSGAAAPYAVGTEAGASTSRQPDSVVRPSRVRAMLASRACRSSIMIGRALEPRSMRLILEHLSQLHSPWNCPHGRPTMRHLALLPAPELQP